MEFGFFKGLPHTGSNENFSDYKKFNNSISKENVISHIRSLEAGLTSEPSIELFTGEKFRAGIYDDGDFVFPYEFLHYYANYDIGIPYEYENYLKSIGVGQEKKGTEN